ncbi:hypothetical protein B0O80DRAFT_205052 [Mortierella sp. GBAus27b]|nr:hypothetical protein B0O80DRAFT_205052 [Mortierella sp. GBAus27b]
MNKKLREPLEQPNGSGSGSARSSGYGNSTFIPQKSEMVQVDDMPLEPVPALVPTSSRRGSTASRPQSFASGARPETPTVSSPLARPSGSFVADRPASVLTSSFIPPPDDRHQRHQQQQQQQQLLHHQQLQQQQQQQHQEHQQQLNNGTYPV